MNILFLIMIIVGVSMQNVCKRTYGNKMKDDGIFLFNCVMSLAAGVFFAVAAKGRVLSFDTTIIPYSVAFAVSYIMASVGSVFAVYYGSLSITALIVSYSLIVPSIYGLVCLGEPISVSLIIGIILLLISLVMININGSEKYISVKWAVFVIIAFLGNGMCSTVQKIFPIYNGDTYSNQFMFIALIISALSMLIIGLIKEPKVSKEFVKKGLGIAALCGVVNGAVNLLVMLLNGKMPASVMFPLISAGGIVLTFFISVLIYKEKLSKIQILGFLTGVASIILLNM